MTVHRSERMLAFMIAGLFILSVLAIAAVLIAYAVSLPASAPIWPTILHLPFFALPIAFILIIALIIVSGRRRSREAREDAEAAAIVARPKPPARVQPKKRR